MAIDPDGILGKSKAPLTPEEIKSADDFESEIDDYLLMNFYDGGFVTFAFADPIELRVLYELIRRYREANWGTYVSPSGELSGEKNYSLPLITFWKRGDTPVDRIQKMLTDKVM